MFSVQCSVFSVKCSVLSVKCSVFSVQCSVFSVQCSVFSVQCLVYIQCRHLHLYYTHKSQVCVYSKGMNIEKIKKRIFSPF